MRKYSYLAMLAVAALFGAACNNTGFDGSWLGYNGGSNNANGAATLPEVIVAALQPNGLWMSPESLAKYNQCTAYIIIQTFPVRTVGTFGRVADTGEYSPHEMGAVISYVKDVSGEGHLSGPSVATLGAGGVTSGLAFGNYCAGGTTAPFTDAITFRQNWPAPYSTGVTDNLSGFMVPVYANDSNTHDTSLAAIDRLPLAKRIEILNTIDVNNDIVRTDLGNGKFREDIRATLTSITFDGSTFVPSEPMGVTIVNFTAFAYDPSDPKLKPVASWLADRLQASVDAGTEPVIEVVINGSVTVSSVDAKNLFPTVQYAYDGQIAVDLLRQIAGLSPAGSDEGRVIEGSER